MLWRKISIILNRYDLIFAYRFIIRYALAVGPRRTVDFKKVKPSNVSDVYIGISFLN